MVQGTGTVLSQEELAIARLVEKLGFSVTRESIQYVGKSGVRPATDVEKKLWGALLETELEYAEAEGAILHG